MIINKQPDRWFWKEKVFYIYSDGDIIEPSPLGSKGGYNYYSLPKIKKRNLLLRIVAKNKRFL